MPSEKDNILGFNQYMKSDKMLYIIYADIESFIKKIVGCANNPDTLYRGKICSSLREHAKNTLDFEKKDMLQLTKEELKSHQDAKVCYIG